jgi:hypothetical protein
MIFSLQQKSGRAPAFKARPTGAAKAVMTL